MWRYLLTVFSVLLFGLTAEGLQTREILSQVLPFDSRSLLQSHGRALGGNYDLLNKILGDLTLTLNTSAVDPIEEEIKVIGMTLVFKAVLNDTAVCKGIQIGNIDLSLAGNDTEKQLDLLVENIQLECTVGLCVSTNMIGDSPSCGGTITIHSLPTSKTNLAVTEIVRSQDFNSHLPYEAFELNQTCEEKVQLQGCTFSGKNIHRYIIDLTSLIISVINGDSMKPRVLAPITDIACEMLETVTTLLSDFIIENPLVDIVNSFADVTVVDQAKLAEDSLPKDVDFINIGKNLVVDMLFPGHNETIVLTPETFEVGCSNTTSNNTTPLWDMVDAYLGTNMSENGGNIYHLDVIATIEHLFSINITKDMLSIELPLPSDMGSIGGSLNSLYFGATPGEDPLYKGMPLTFLNNETVLLPELWLGDVSVNASLGFFINVTGFDFLGSTIAFDLTDSTDLALTWDSFSLELAGLLAMQMDTFLNLEFGPLFAHIIDCILAIFFKTPALAGLAVGSTAIGLELSGAFDGITNVVTDFVNAVVPIFHSSFAPFIEYAANATVVNAEIISPATCPSAVDTDPKELYDFSQGIVHFVSGLVTADSLECLLHKYFIDVDGTLPLITTPIDFDVDLPGGDGYEVKLLMNSLNVTGLLPPVIDALTILGTPESSQYYPHGLWNQIGLGDAGTPLTLDLVLALDVAKSGRRMLTNEQTNEMTITLSMDNINLLLDIYAALSKYTVESKTLGNFLNLNCWMADLEPYGGIKELLLDLNGVHFNMNCTNCENDVLKSLAEKLSDPVSFADFMSTINKIKSTLTTSVVDMFNEQNWNKTINDAKVRCQGGTPDKKGSLPDEVDQDLTGEYVFVGFYFGVIGMIGACTFGCTIGKPQLQHVHKLKEQGEPLEQIPLFRHPSIPMWAKVSIPLVLVINLTLFIVAHVGDVLYINIAATILGDIDVNVEDFSTLSVVNTTIKLWQGGAYLMALLLAIFSIIWPYVKLVGVGLTWFLPGSYLSFKTRGKIITALDQLGKWSLVELFFLLFIFVVMQITIYSPTSISYVPQGLYEVALVIVPQYNMYTFTLALMLSLLVSNVEAYLHESIDHEIMKAKRVARGLDHADEQPIGLQDYVFEETDARGQRYRVVLNKCGVFFLTGSVLFSVAFIIYSGTLTVIELHLLGLVKVAMDISDQDTTIPLSLFSFIQQSFTDRSAGEYFFAVVFVLCVLIIPLIQLSMLVVIPWKKFTLDGAIRFLEVNKALSAWCSLESFVFAMALTCLEITTAISFLMADTCDALQPIMATAGSLFGIFSEQDIASVCLGLTASVQPGCYTFFAALFVGNIAHLFAVKLFEQYINARRHSGIHFEMESDIDLEKKDTRAGPGDDLDDEMETGKANLGIVVSILERLRLLSVERDFNKSIVPAH